METEATEAQGIEVTDEDIGREPPAPKTEGKDTASQSQPETKDKGPAPWDAKLTELGLTDPKFSEFIRTEIQPYITQLEQGGGDEVSELFGGDQELAGAAADMIQQLIDDPMGFFEELQTELVSRGLFPEGDDEYSDEEYGDYEDDEQAYDDDPDPEREWVRQQMEQREQQQADEYLEGELDRIEEMLPGYDRGLFIQLLIANNGDMHGALAAYQPYYKAPEPEPQAPPATGEGMTPPPTSTQPTSIDGAIDDFLSDVRAGRS